METAENTKKKSDIKEPEKKETFAGSTISLFLIIFFVFAFKSSILDANNIPSGSMIPTLKIGDFLFVNKMRYSLRIPFFSETEIFRYDDPKRGDIVTFNPPDDAIQEDVYTIDSAGNVSRPKKVQIPILSDIFAKRFVKRVVGMPGDEIRISQKRFKASNGEFVDYTWIEYREKGSDEFKTYNPTPVQNHKELSDVDNLRAIGKSLFTEEKRDFKHFVLEGYHSASYSFIRRNCPENTCKIPEGHYLVMGDNRDDSSDSRFWGFVRREDILGKALILYFSINWKDFTCMFKSIPEDNSVESVNLQRYSKDDLEKQCTAAELNNEFHSESLPEWIFRTLKYRIWRMNVRWERIGRILQ